MNEGPQKFEKTEEEDFSIEVTLDLSPDDVEDATWVDFYGGRDEELGIKSPEGNSYVISSVSEKNLFSDKYQNCTGTVGIGRDKETSKNIAFISHQDPEYFLHKGSEQTEKFANDLKETLNELIDRSEDGTVEVVLFGGNEDIDDPDSKEIIDYYRSIEKLSEIIESCMDQPPTVIEFPSRATGSIQAEVLTQERKIFLG